MVELAFRFSVVRCACCGLPSEGNFEIHRDGWGIGPEVSLCDDCGGRAYPTCDEIWAAIADQRPSGGEAGK